MIETQARFRQIFDVDSKPADRALESMTRKAGALDGTFKKVGLAIGGMFALGAAKAFVSDASRAFSEVRKLALEMGSTAQVADALSDAFTEAGLDAGEMSSAMQRWAMVAAAAKKAGEELPEGMEVWRKAGDGALKSFPEGLARIAKQMEGLGSEQEKIILATEAYGRSGRRLMPILAQGEAAVRKMIEVTKDGIFTEENVEKAHRFHVAVARAEDKIGDMKASLALKLMPALEVLADHAETFAQAIVVAASAWAGMKIQEGAAALVRAAIAMRTVAATQAAGGLGAAAGAAASGAATGSRAGGWGAVAGAVISLGAMAWGSRKGGGDRNEAVERRMQAEERAVEQEEAGRKVEEKAAEATKRFEKAIGFTSERMKELGFDVAAAARDVKAGGAAMRSTMTRIQAAEMTSEGRKAEQQGEIVQGAALKAAGLLAEKRGGGFTWEQMRRRIEHRTRESIAGLAPERGPLGSETLEEQRARAARPWVTGTGQTAADIKRAEAESQWAVAKLRTLEAARTNAAMEALFEPPTVNNNFNGPITIQNDLRGEDPDRVMFGLDQLVKLSEHRTTSRMVPAFLQR